MTRIKGGVHANKRRKNILERAKGYRGIRSKKLHAAHEALMRAGRYAFAHRRDKKTDFRQLWIVRLNAALRENGQKSYSTFINKLKKADIKLDRKVLAQFASEHPTIFSRIAKQVVKTKPPLCMAGSSLQHSTRYPLVPLVGSSRFTTVRGSILTNPEGCTSAVALHFNCKIVLSATCTRSQPSLVTFARRYRLRMWAEHSPPIRGSVLI